MNVDIETIAKHNMHPALFKPRQWAWVKAMVAPFKTLYNELKAYEDATDKLLRPNNQTIVQQVLLNDLYDATLRRIYIITEGDELPDNYLYNRTDIAASETLMLFGRVDLVGSATLYNRADYNNSYDFTVYLPASLSSQEATIRATIERYRLASIIYRIIYI